MKEIIKLFAFIFCVKVIFANDEFLAKFHQNDYKIRDFRLDVESYDKSIVRFMVFKTFKFNRTTPAVNATMNYKIDLGDKSEVVLQAYKFLSNEYRHFPVRFQVNVKKAMKANLIGISAGLLKCGNFSFEFYKDTTYHLCNFVIDESQFPPLIPTGKYKSVFEFLFHDRVFAILHMYFEIYRPITIKN